MKSGREDLNLRPPAPEAGALAGLRYAPILKVNYTTTDADCQINFIFPNFIHRKRPTLNATDPIDCGYEAGFVILTIFGKRIRRRWTRRSSASQIVNRIPR